MRRRPGALLPLEVSVLAAGLALRATGVPEFHGFLIARKIQASDRSRNLTAHGTLYKALDRMTRAGLLTDRWEDPDVAAADSRPRRRLYRLTPAAEVELAAAVVAGQAPTHAEAHGGS